MLFCYLKTFSAETVGQRPLRALKLLYTFFLNICLFIRGRERERASAHARWGEGAEGENVLADSHQVGSLMQG